MNSFAQNDQTSTAQPSLKAEQALRKVLALIRDNKKVTEFTAERLSQAFNVDVQYAKDNSGRYGFGEAISSDWSYGFDVNNKVKDLQGKEWPKFNFSFNPTIAGSTPEMSEICTSNFDVFTAELEALGFKRERRYAEHGRWLYDEFNSSSMRVQVYIQNTLNTSDGRASSACVRMIEIV